MNEQLPRSRWMHGAPLRHRCPSAYHLAAQWPAPEHPWPNSVNLIEIHIMNTIQNSITELTR